MTDTARRPTPADPTPGVARADQIPSRRARNLPPELGPDAIGVFEGQTFMFSNAAGDVPSHTIGGLVHYDTRFLSRWELTINDEPLFVLNSDTVEDYSAAFFLANPEMPGLAANTVGIRRQRFIGDGMHERIELRPCGCLEPMSLQVRLAVGADFADLFEIKESVRDRSAQITRSHAADGSRLNFVYRNGSFEAATEVRACPPASRVEGDDLVWEITLASDQEWHCELRIPLQYGGGLPQMPVVASGRHFGEFVEADRNNAVTYWRSTTFDLRSNSDLLCEVYEQSVSDLIGMRIERRIDDEPVMLLSAGLPWFLTLFGRDMLITAYQAIASSPILVRGVLRVFARYQATEFDDFTDSEPGKILHEYRSGELTQLGLKPHSPYYGAADTTQLWLILLSEFWRWTGDDDFVCGLRDNAYAALRWIDDYGDLDHDGYVEYASRSPEGLGNQCWRDSYNGILFSNADMPVLPIATCEIQGYTYDAKLRFAELADGPFNDPDLAHRLRGHAQELRERFNRDFWIDNRGGYYALGLDGDKRQIDTMTSNMGHLLWSGILPPDRATTVARQLMSDQMFSGWGVRTTSNIDRAYNPIGYHMGTVWPHDNSIIAYGLACYGFRQEANRIVMAMLSAAKYSGFRLPEAFAGYDRAFGRTPVRYPTACDPQAWASGAPLLFIRTMLGLCARDGRPRVDPNIPEEVGRIHLIGVPAFGKRWEIEATQTQSSVSLGD